jgi:SAM-dependent methyltransferase
VRTVDRILQSWRLRQALAWLPGQVRVIDVGAFRGELFHALGPRLAEGFGLEPLLVEPRTGRNYLIVPGFFPEHRPAAGGWHAITMLAVLEHIPRDQQASLVEACHDLLAPGGRVIITVPGRAVDTILAVLKFLHLIDGMSLEEHYGFEPADTPGIFAPPRFRLVHASRFQLGLNHLFVFEKLPAD